MTLLLSLTPAALAATLHVGPGQAYTDLGAALASAADRDEVYVHAGTYELSGTHTVLADDVTVRGEGAELVSIVPAPGGDCALSVGALGVNGTGVRLEGLSSSCQLWPQYRSRVEVRDVHVSGADMLLWALEVEVVDASVTDGQLLVNDALEVRLSGVEVVGGGGSVVRGHPFLGLPVEARITDSRFIDAEGAGLFVDKVDRLIFLDNWVCGATDSGLFVDVGDDGTDAVIRRNRWVGNEGGIGGGLVVSGRVGTPARVALVDNVFWANRAIQALSVWLSSVPETHVVNNVFGASVHYPTNGAGSELLLDDAPVVLDHNLWWASPRAFVEGPATTGPNAVFADPMFVAPSTDCSVADFGLLPGSPALDAGHPSMLDPDGTVSDIGG